MKKGWKIITLGDLYNIKSSRRVFESEWKSSGVPFYRAREIVKLAQQGFVDNKLYISEEMYNQYSEKYGIPKEDDIMVTGVGTLGICYVVKKNDRFYFKDGNIIWLKKNSDVNSQFVEYAFQSDFLRNQIDDSVGATVGTFTIIKAKNTRIPIPPLPEQQRIVAVLDEAFASILQSKSIAERNLVNAREMFGSVQNEIFTLGGKDWEEKRIDEICVNLDSQRIPVTKRDREEGQYPYYGASGIVDYVSKFIFDEDLLLVSEDGANLLARTYPIAYSICGRTWVNNHAHVLRFEKMATQKFVEYYLNSIPLDDYVSGMAQPKLNQAMLNSIVIPFPPFVEQRAIVKRLEALQAETRRLESIYQQKVQAFDELKKSLLAQAFSGEL